jgi:hypothetical protein
MVLNKSVLLATLSCKDVQKFARWYGSTSRQFGIEQAAGRSAETRLASDALLRLASFANCRAEIPYVFETTVKPCPAV